MSLTPQEAFRFGFLLRCADEGLNPEQVTERVKMAREKVASPLSLNGLATAAKALYSTGMGLGVTGLAGGALLGGTGGYIAARATDDDVDPEEAKKHELIAMYRQQADRARRTAARSQYRTRNRAPRPSSF